MVHAPVLLHQDPPRRTPVPAAQASRSYAADVVDELRLVIAPRIAGRGRRLLDGLPPVQLESIRNSTSPSGHLLAGYRVTR